MYQHCIYLYVNKNKNKMIYTINTRRTIKGWIIKLIRIGDRLMVVSHHDKRRGTSTRYSGTSMDAAVKAFLK